MVVEINCFTINLKIFFFFFCVLGIKQWILTRVLGPKNRSYRNEKKFVFHLLSPTQCWFSISRVESNPSNCELAIVMGKSFIRGARRRPNFLLQLQDHTLPVYFPPKINGHEQAPRHVVIAKPTENTWHRSTHIHACFTFPLAGREWAARWPAATLRGRAF